MYSSWTSYTQSVVTPQVKQINSLVRKIERAPSSNERIKLLAELRTLTEPFEYEYLVKAYNLKP